MLAHPDSDTSEADRETRARAIAERFGSEDAYDHYRTHGRPIRVEELEQVDGLVVRRLEADNELQDAVLSVYHAEDLTFGGPAIKIVENHLGRRWVRIQQLIQIGPQPGAQPAQPGGQQGPRPPQPNRAERRRQERERR
jgi:hypothetical protein